MGRLGDEREAYIIRYLRHSKCPVHIEKVVRKMAGTSEAGRELVQLSIRKLVMTGVVRCDNFFNLSIQYSPIRKESEK